MHIVCDPGLPCLPIIMIAALVRHTQTFVPNMKYIIRQQINHFQVIKETTLSKESKSSYLGGKGSIGGRVHAKRPIAIEIIYHQAVRVA